MKLVKFFRIGDNVWEKFYLGGKKDGGIFWFCWINKKGG